MKKYIILGMAVFCLQTMQAQTLIRPTVKTKTTFAQIMENYIVESS